MSRCLVTGGAGYFGELLAARLLAEGHQVRTLDLNPGQLANAESQIGDIRDRAAVARACRDVDHVFHAVAQVPLAKDRALFWSVNSDGTRILLDEARAANVKKVVYISSSAVFGVPKSNPVTRDTPPMPAEDYGRAKLAGEELCRAASDGDLDVSVVRPRTILGHGRLGVVQILFDWVEHGQDVPVFDGGKNRYQFVHADDLAMACAAAARRPGFAIYNIGSERFGTMRALLEALIRHAGTRSRIRSLPMGAVQGLMHLTSRLGLSPLGPYHALMYGREMFFDIADARRELGYAPRYSDEESIRQGYDWYLAHRDEIARQGGGSPHKSPVRKGMLGLAPLLLKVMPS
jgi:nucleoside-diphosphate-sugar epimerase